MVSGVFNHNCDISLGEHFAVFRGEDGRINVLDAMCPHLGANIAIGGVVSGDCIQCPFHGWVFSGSTGKCVRIPYSDVGRCKGDSSELFKYINTNKLCHSSRRRCNQTMAFVRGKYPDICLVPC